MTCRLCSAKPLHQAKQFEQFFNENQILTNSTDSAVQPWFDMKHIAMFHWTWVPVLFDVIVAQIKIIKGVLFHSPESNFKRSAHDLIYKMFFEITLFKFTTTSPRGQWVKFLVSCFCSMLPETKGHLYVGGLDTPFASMKVGQIGACLTNVSHCLK